MSLRLRHGLGPSTVIRLIATAVVAGVLLSGCSLGGGGDHTFHATFTRAVQLFPGGRVRVLGVNVGRLGFLAEVDVDDLPAALSVIDEQRYTVEARTAVCTVLPGGRPVTG